MFRDTKETLRRLEEQLLEEQEETPEFQPEEQAAAGDCEVYQNYSNDYGRQLRNFASGYAAYNSDKVDEDLEHFSQQVEQGGRRKPGVLIAAVLAVIAAVLGIAACICLVRGGLL